MKDHKKFQAKPFVQMTPNELNTSQRPIQKAELNHYYEQESSNEEENNEENNEEEQEDNPPHHSDKIKCEYCGELYTRSNVTAHRKTKYHKAYVAMNDKIRKLLLNKFDED